MAAQEARRVDLNGMGDSLPGAGGEWIEDLGDDERLSSGVPREQRVSEEDFILMSGLTQPGAAEAPAASAPESALTPDSASAPLSFAEAGVEDVEPGDEQDPMAETLSRIDLVESMAQESLDVAAIRDIIAGLSRDQAHVAEGAPPPFAGTSAESPVSGVAASQPDVLEVAGAAAGAVEGPETAGRAVDTGEIAPAASPGFDYVAEIDESEPLPEIIFEEADHGVPADSESAAASEQPVTVRVTPETVAALTRELSKDDVLRGRPGAAGASAPGSAAPAGSPSGGSPVRLSEAPPSTPGLEEAERLLRELQEQTAAPLDEERWEAALPTAQRNPSPRLDAFAGAGPDEEDEYGEGDGVSSEAESVYSRPRSPKRHSRRDPARKKRRKVVGWFVRLGVLALIAAAGYQIYLQAQPFFAAPNELYAQALRLEAAGRWDEAIAFYNAFIDKNPRSPESVEAQFRAACLLQAPRADEAPAQTQSRLREAGQAFERFARQYPDDPRAVRALILAGIVSYQLGDYTDAIDKLHDPELRLKDPVSALPILRTLARAYGELGDMGAARSAYLQAASLQGNYAPDADFDELAKLYKRASEVSTDPAVTREYQELAIQMWNQAIRSPGISPDTKSAIKFRRDQLQNLMRDRLPSADALAPARDRTPLAPEAAEEDASDAASPASEPPESGPAPEQEAQGGASDETGGAAPSEVNLEPAPADGTAPAAPSRPVTPAAE